MDSITEMMSIRTNQHRYDEDEYGEEPSDEELFDDASQLFYPNADSEELEEELGDLISD